MINFITVMSIIILILVAFIVLLITADYLMFTYFKSSRKISAIIDVILYWIALLFICISLLVIFIACISSAMVLWYPFT